MSIEIAYKATQPDLLQQFEADRAQVLKDHFAKCDAFKETIGDQELFGTRYYDGGFEVSGFMMDSYRDEVPVGWRQEQRTRHAVPAKRTPEGRAIAAQLAKLRLPAKNYPGFPNMLWAPGFTTYPRLHALGGDYYMTASKLPDAPELERIDAKLWTRVKLSEYFAATEAAAEAAEREAFVSAALADPEGRHLAAAAVALAEAQK